MTKREKRELTVLRRQRAIALGHLAELLSWMVKNEELWVTTGMCEEYNRAIRGYALAGGEVRDG